MHPRVSQLLSFRRTNRILQSTKSAIMGLMKEAEYRNHDAVGLAELIANGEISAKEAMETAIRQIEALNPALNAVVHTTYDRAARIVEAELPATPLAGVPFMLKDLGQFWEGVPTTSGSRALLDFIAPFTTTLTSRYLAGGLVILGKTSTPEFGMASVTEPAVHGATNNPWDPEITAGGSSGGSASVVAGGNSSGGPCQRRRRLDTHTRLRLWPGWTEAHPGKEPGGTSDERRMVRPVRLPCGQPDRAGFGGVSGSHSRTRAG